MAMASLRVSVMLMRKRDGKLCPLATTSFVATDSTASRSNRSKAGATAAVWATVRCAGPFVLPPMLEGHQLSQQPGNPPVRHSNISVAFSNSFLRTY